MNPRPQECRGCPLDLLGEGFVPPELPEGAEILFLGEAPGEDEAKLSRPFVGRSGARLDRVLHRIGLERGKVAIGNVLACFPGDTRFIAQGVERLYRRLYAGEIVTLALREGHLTGTPNHPVATTRGWVPLGLVVEGDHLIRGSLAQEVNWCNPYIEHHSPQARQLFDALADFGVRQRMVGTNVDFHGDGNEAEIDVVSINGLLWDQGHPALLAPSTQGVLARTLESLGSSQGRCPCKGAAPFLRHRNLSSSTGLVRCNGQRGSSGSVQGVPAQVHGFGLAAQLDAPSKELSLQPTLPDTETFRDGLEPFPLAVGTDQVVKVKRSWFMGHVYNLQVTGGQYTANGYIVHNCRPPDNRLDRSYAAPAIAHCAVHREKWLRDPRFKLVVPLGGSALKVLHGFEREKALVKDFHGQPVLDPQNRWTTATFHPAYLLKKPALTGMVYWDLRRALKVMQEGWTYDQPRLVIDPPVEWLHRALDTIEAAPEGSVWLFADTETQGKSSDEGLAKVGTTKHEREVFAKQQLVGSALLTRQNPSAKFIRYNLAWSTAEGCTFPADGPDGPYTQVWRRAMALKVVKVFWNGPFDVDRSELWDCPVADPWMDGMDAAHVLQSDLPKGLGFWAPMYSHAAPWKHLVTVDEGVYAAMDPVQTARITLGVVRDLEKLGMWEVFRRHLWLLDVLCLRPAKKIGLGFDKDDLLAFHDELDTRMEGLTARMQELYPREILRLEPKYGLQEHPQDGSDVLEEKRLVPVLRCSTCGAEERVGPAHKCKGEHKGKEPQVEQVARERVRYFRRVPFNPESQPQVLRYVLHQGHEPGTNKAKTPSVDKLALARLQRTGDPFYATLMEYRQATKMQSAFVESTLARLDQNNRVHPTARHNPSTLRLSYEEPNPTQVAKGRDGREIGKKLAQRYRSTVRAAKGAVLLELDFNAIEAVVTGWCAKDPNFIRAAKLGVHGMLSAAWLKKPAPEHWSEQEKGAYYQTIKEQNKAVYNRSKIVVYRTLYGGTPEGMLRTDPDEFSGIREAAQFQGLLFKLSPKLKAWQEKTIQQAHHYGFLGGTADDPARRRALDAVEPPDVHPYGYKHTFWEVNEVYRKKNGEWGTRKGHDRDRCLAFEPQSITRGIITEACLRLFDPENPSYIGHTFFGETPLRVVIHDALFMEVEEQHYDWVMKTAYDEMTRPIKELPCPPEWNLGEYLSIGVAVETGYNWGPYDERANPEGMRGVPPEDVGVASDKYSPEEDEEELEVSV